MWLTVALHIPFSFRRILLLLGEPACNQIPPPPPSLSLALLRLQVAFQPGCFNTNTVIDCHTLTHDHCSYLCVLGIFCFFWGGVFTLIISHLDLVTYTCTLLPLLGFSPPRGSNGYVVSPLDGVLRSSCSRGPPSQRFGIGMSYVKYDRGGV